MEAFDCELLRSGFPGQPVNTWSSFAFVAASLVLFRRGHRVPAAAMAVAGVGSVLFHGSPSGFGSWLHDIGLYATIAIGVLEVWRLMARRRPPVAAIGVFAVGVLVWFASRTGGVLCAPDSAIQGHAVWHVLAAIAFLLLYVDWRSLTQAPAARV